MPVPMITWFAGVGATTKFATKKTAAPVAQWPVQDADDPGGDKMDAGHLLSVELFMMAYRLSAEQPKPAAFKEALLSRWALRVHRVVHGTVVARVTNFVLPIFYVGVVAWLARQRTAQGVYHSVMDVGVAFAVVYCNMFLMLYRAHLFARVREAAHIARAVEELIDVDEAMAKDIRQTVRQVQLIFGLGSMHPFAMFVLFTTPTLLTGQSPSPLLPKNSLPAAVEYCTYLLQDFSISVADSCLMLMEYVHLGTTLSASLLYRMLAARFCSPRPLSAAQLHHLVSLHQRLIANTSALQDLLSVTVLLTMTGAVLGLVASTLSVMGQAPSEVYVYLILPTCVGYIAMKCAAGDQLLSWSRDLADKVYACPWTGQSRDYCTTVVLLIAKAQRPQVMVARYVGQLDIPTARNIFNRWYTFVQYLQRGLG